MKNVIIGLLIVAMILPFVSADVIMEGYHPISTINIISNYENYQDYYFISGGPIMCRFEIAENGVIPGCYKNSPQHAYIVSKTKEAEYLVEKLNNESLVENMSMNEAYEYKEKLISINGGKKVLENIPHYMQVKDTSTIGAISYYYEVSLDKVSSQPVKTEITRNYLFYVYILLPIIALAILGYIVYKRRK